MQVKQNFLQQIQSDGFALVPELGDEAQVNELVTALVAAHDKTGTRSNRNGIYAMRNLMQIEAVQNWAHSENLRCVLAPILGENYFPTRGILFVNTGCILKGLPGELE